MSSVDTGALLAWCQRNTVGYNGVEVNGFGECWRDGLAFCALIHKFHPDKIEYTNLIPTKKFENLTTAFQIGQQLGVAYHIDPLSILAAPTIDSNELVTYLSHCYNAFHITQMYPIPRPSILLMKEEDKHGMDKCSSAPNPSHIALQPQTPTAGSLDKIMSVNFAPTPSPLAQQHPPHRSPSPSKMRKYPKHDNDEKEVTFEEREPDIEPERPKTPKKMKKVKKDKETDGKKEKENGKVSTKTTATPTPKDAKIKTPKAKTTTSPATPSKVQAASSNPKYPTSSASPKTPRAPDTPKPRPASAPPARPSPSSTSTKKETPKTPRISTPTPRSAASPTPRKSAAPKEKKSKKDRPITPSTPHTLTPDTVESHRVHALEMEVAQLKQKLNDYKLHCETLEAKLFNEMELRKKVVQQLQGFKLPE